MADAVGQFLDIIDNRIEKHLDGNTYGYVRQRGAVVTEYDDDSKKAFVYFIDDESQTQYTFYNKTNELLSSGDNVKVYYVTNIAKGWIGERCGEPNVKEIRQIIPYASKHIYNSTDAELGELPVGILDIDFTISDNNSDCHLNANQIIDVIKEGTVQYSYFVDNVESEFHPMEVLPKGKNVFTHVFPMELLAGKHNIKAKMFSLDATGLTSAGDIQGVICGQISDISIENPPIYSCVFKFTIDGGIAFTFPNLSTSGRIYWGDGSSDVYNGEITHTYAESGDYKITLDAPLTKLANPIGAVAPFTDDTKARLKECVLSDDIVSISTDFFSRSNLRTIKFGKNIVSIQAGTFSYSQLTGNLSIPKTVNYIGSDAFRGTNLTSVIIDNPKQDIGIVDPIRTQNVFNKCELLTVAVLNYTGVICAGMFTYCYSLQKLTIGNNITQIGTNAFRECALTELVIPEGVVRIEDGAFMYCPISTITIAKSVKYIGWNAFIHCTFRSVTIAKDCVIAGASSLPSGCTINYYDD